MLKEDVLFTEELLMLEHSQKLINLDEIECNTLRSEYQVLAMEYNKLLKLSKKLISMADKSQKQLKDSNELVNDKVIKLTLAEQQLRKMTITDPLTGLLNRRGILNWLQDEGLNYKRHKIPFTLFVIDIDFFKDINDEYGHNIGDLTLKALADLMTDSIRSQDYIARWGGEEFLLVLPQTSLDGGCVIAEKMRKRIEEKTFIFKDFNINITISLGGCDFKDDITLSACLDMADKALYKSKHNGRNKVTLYEY